MWLSVRSASKVIWSLDSAEKKDIIDFKVTEINEDSIKGRLGPAEVLIPKSKMDSINCEYVKDENYFMVRLGEMEGKIEKKIDKGSKVRCKCFEIRI